MLIKKVAHYMNINDINEWMINADDDFDSALIVNESDERNLDVICNLCAQAAEKYLKCYLAYNDHFLQSTNNLVFLNDQCIKINNCFLEIKMDCDYLNRYINDLHYHYKNHINEKDVIDAIKSIEKVRNMEVFVYIREEISENENDKN